METTGIPDPWDVITDIVEDRNVDRLHATLRDLPAAERALAISRLSIDTRSAMFALLHVRDAADLLEEIPEQAVDVVENLPVDVAARILDKVQSDHQADIVGELDPENANAILAQMNRVEAEDVRKLLTYDENSAGGIMLTEYLAYPVTSSIQEILDDMRRNARRYADYSVQYLYVVDELHKLVGVLRIRDLVLTPPGANLKDILIPDPIRVHVDTSIEDLQATFERHALFGLPVVDNAGVFVGIVRRSAVEAAIARQGSRLFLKFSGIIGGEEFRTMPFGERVRRRLSWLSINIVLNLVAASVIAYYQDTLAAVIALAVFLPMISDMSGCSGNQAVAVSIRELSLGLVRPQEIWRVMRQEILVGLFNGLALGVLLGAVAYLWKGDVDLGIVVGIALAANTIVSVCMGGLLPLVLKRIRLDPALVSSPMLTTVTDMCGFFLVLSIATMFLQRLA
jgi:magnesium transporter